LYIIVDTVGGCYVEVVLMSGSQQIIHLICKCYESGHYSKVVYIYTLSLKSNCILHAPSWEL